MRRLSGTGADVTEFTVAPRYPSAGEPRGGHDWLIEFRVPLRVLEEFADALDEVQGHQRHHRGRVDGGERGGGADGGDQRYLNARLRYMVNWTQYWYDNSRGAPFSCGQPACNAGQVRRVDEATSLELLMRLQIYF